ncbi:unnamed protein product [Calypogeia fissa]
MAFTSKVVFVLLVSSLAWCQASAQESKPVGTIVKGLGNLTTLINSLTTEVNEIEIGNFINEGPKVVQGIVNIAQNFSVLYDYLETLPKTPLSDPEGKILEAYQELVVAVQNLMNALSDQYTPTGLEDFAPKLRTALEGLLNQAIPKYSYDLLYLYSCSQIKKGLDLRKALGVAIIGVIDKYNN